MTLILGMSKAEGIYMSTDYRVTRRGKLVDDAAVKFLHAIYPPEGQGPRALFGFTGIAVLPDGTPTGTWLRETLRGETEVFDDSMAHLRTRLDRDIAHLRSPLIIDIIVTQQGRRFLGAFHNVKLEETKMFQVTREFTYSMEEPEDFFAFASGSGVARVLADGHLERLQDQLKVRPRKPLDHMKLLATINRRVAAADPTKSVSPFCHVAFINADDRTSPLLQVFVEQGEYVPFEMPMLLYGIDLSGISRRHHKQFEAWLEGGPPPGGEDPDKVNKELQRRP